MEKWISPKEKMPESYGMYRVQIEISLPKHFGGTRIRESVLRYSLGEFKMPTFSSPVLNKLARFRVMAWTEFDCPGGYFIR